jgi:hypothetical protein
MGILFTLTKPVKAKAVHHYSIDQNLYEKVAPHEICFNIFIKNGSANLIGVQTHPNPNHIAVTARTVAINTLRTIFGL